MIVTLLGGAGAGKTTIAKAMEKYVKDSFVIDGDELRAETANMDIGVSGREANMHLGFSRARRLSDLGFTVFIAMQAPIKEIRDQYLSEHDVEILIINEGDNPKDAKGYNRNFNPDYSGVNLTQILQEFSEDSFYELVFPKVLVPARFQGFHKGHKVVLEEAKRLSPNITVGLRVDGEDIIDLDKNIKLLESRGYNTIKTPDIGEDWTDFANQYDIYVQGNPVVIEKFKDSNCKLFHVPRYGDVSGTNIRKTVSNGLDVLTDVDQDVQELIKESL
jgi:cytidyltransferase-like protein